MGTEDQEVVERSEMGYRTKRKIIPGTAPGEQAAPAKPSCFSRCFTKCFWEKGESGEGEMQGLQDDLS